MKRTQDRPQPASRQMRLILTEARRASRPSEWDLDPATRSRGLKGVAEARRALDASRVDDEQWSEAS